MSNAPQTATRQPPAGHTHEIVSSGKMSFADMGLKEEILKGLRARDWLHPTPIQEEGIPVILSGRNAVIRAKNGTGKTGTFSIPVLQAVDPTKRYVQAVVLARSRELAMQIAKEIKELGKFVPTAGGGVTGANPLYVMCTIGGHPRKEDIERLRTQPIHVIVGTPGRLKDLAQRGEAKLNRVKLFVLDEADTFMEERGDRDIYMLLRLMHNRNRTSDNPLQIVMASATFNRATQRYVDRHIPKRDYVLVNTMRTKEVVPIGLSLYYAYVPVINNRTRKGQCLHVLLSNLNINKAIIFVNHRTTAQKLYNFLKKQGYDAVNFTHSGLEEDEREQIFHSFRESGINYLITTDIFARGIDNPNVNVVINYDLPMEGTSFLHRAGRGGRYGQKAVCISIVAEQAEVETLSEIMRQLNAEIKHFKSVDDIPLSEYVADSVQVNDADEEPAVASLN